MRLSDAMGCLFDFLGLSVTGALDGDSTGSTMYSCKTCSTTDNWEVVVGDAEIPRCLFPRFVDFA